MKMSLNGVWVSFLLVCSMVCPNAFAQYGGAPGFGGYTNPMADNKNHYACWAGSGNYPSEAVSYYNWWQGSNKWVTGVDIIPIVPNACPYLTDMMLDDQYYSAVSYGHWTCFQPYNDPVDGLMCLWGAVEINKTTLTAQSTFLNYPYSQAALSTWCHEVGHSYGIWHEYWDGSCTKGDPGYNSPVTYTWDELVLMQFYIP